MVQGCANNKDNKMKCTIYDIKFRPTAEHIFFIFDPSNSCLMFLKDDLERDEYVEEVMMKDYNEHGIHFDGHSVSLLITGVATHRVRKIEDDFLKWGLCHLGSEEDTLD